MHPHDLRQHFRGVIAFPVTPFKADLSLDLDGLRKNLRALLAHPVCAIAAAAGTGEFHCLSPQEHLAVVQTTLEEVNGKRPVLAGVGINPQIAREQVQACARAGVNGILAFPSYYPSMDDEGVVAYYRAIGEASNLGLLVYSRDGFNPSPALVEKLASSIPTLIERIHRRGRDFERDVSPLYLQQLNELYNAWIDSAI